MEGHLGQGEPARPVVAAEHERSRDNGERADNRHAKDFELERHRRAEVARVINEADRADDDVDARDDGHRQWALVHDGVHKILAHWRKLGDVTTSPSRPALIAMFLLSTATAADAVHVWEKHELTFTCANSYANPYTDVT